MKLAIIGAGISGLIAAHTLKEKFDVTLLDKARGVAGRMATRRVPGHDVRFDHGAQYFTIRDPQCQPLLKQWLDQGVVTRWEGQITALGPGATPREENPERYVGVPGMNALGKALAEGLNVHLETTIHTATKNEFDQWLLSDQENRQYGPFDVVICTAPPEQTAKILGDANPWSAKVNGVTMNPCWATMLLFQSRLEVPLDGAFIQGSPLAWISRESSKPGRDASRDCWVLHASQEWSVEHLEEKPESITPQLQTALAEILEIELPEVVHAASHRWRYSIPANPLEETCLWDAEAKLGVCGDWCGGPRVEGAILSGLGLGKILLEESEPPLE